MIAYFTVLYERTCSDSIALNLDNNYSVLCSNSKLILIIGLQTQLLSMSA